MADNNGIHLVDLAEFLVRRKELLLLVFVAMFVVCYVSIYLFIEEQYEATAVLIPREEDASSVASSLLRSAKGLPFGIGSKTARTDMDLYNTVIFSRSMMEDAIRTFDLVRRYRMDSTAADCMELAVKRLSREVTTKETEESAFEVTVRAGSRQLASDMANYIVDRMNQRIVELHTSKSKDNREFLALRVDEISTQLRHAEDSLRAYQERTGLLDVKTQLAGILTANTSLETELEAKKLQEGIMERMYDPSSPQVKELMLQIDVYEKRLAQLRRQNEPGSPLLPLEKLPETTVEFLRRYREVELNNLLLEYVLPLYEQARIEEKKDYPVLQIIDQAIPPARKSYPPRTLFALVGACSSTLILIVVLVVRSTVLASPDPRWRHLFAELRRWRWNSGGWDA